MADQRPKDSSDFDDECRLLPASELGGWRAKEKHLRLITGYLALLLLLLFATNAATAIYFSKSNRDAPSHTYSIIAQSFETLKLKITDTDKLPSSPLNSIGRRFKP